MSAGGQQPERAPAAPRTPAADREAEADLLHRLAAGERGDALAELAERYAARLYDLGLSLLGAPESAERFAAEAVEAVATRAGEFDARAGSPREFIYETARGRLARLAAGEEGDARASAAGEEFETVVADVEFRAAVAGVGDEGRGVLDGILGEGLTRAEVGERLGLTVGIVEVRLRTALRAVRDELDARGVAADGGR